MTLINSILTNMPSYQFSFYKVPLKVVKEIVAIQRNFMWSGVVEKKGLAWVIWEVICKYKLDGGLDVKDVRSFNKALLSKWPWRFMVEENGIWSGMLKVRYVNVRKRMWGCEKIN